MDSPNNTYVPTPIPTDGVTMPASLEPLQEFLAENTHEHWAKQRIAEGWRVGKQRDDDLRTHPGLVPYDQLPDSEKNYDRIVSVETVKAILAKGYRILPPTNPAPVAPGPLDGPALMRHFKGAHPKRILALDGGGIKGVLTLGYLERIEALLAKRLHETGKIDDPNSFRLCQYFDLIGGTSTGSIIAGALAMGWRATDLKKAYLELGGDVFRGDGGALSVLFRSRRFNKKGLEKHLRKIFGDTLLGGSELQTGLCVVSKRADTRSTWPLINHPDGTYFEYNKPLMLWRVIRASTAAPTFFEPQLLPTGDLDEKGRVVKGAFVDGGVSMANNPSMQLFLAAVLKGFPFRWPTGADNLLLVSVGTGSAKVQRTAEEVMKFNLLDLVQEIPQMLMDDASIYNQLLLQAFSNSPTRTVIDSEIGDCYNDLIGGNPLLRYARYDAFLEADFLRDTLQMPALAKRAKKLQDMSQASNRFDLADIGTKAAEIQIPEDPQAFEAHFPKHFDHVIQ